MSGTRRIRRKALRVAGRTPRRSRAGRMALAGALLAVGAGLATVLAWQPWPGQPSALGLGGQAAAGAPPAPGLPPLPVVSHTVRRPAEAIREAYVFAARHPEVLQYVPCFCGCERQGHRSSLDCFVASRDSEGRVSWNAHAIG